MKRLLIALLLCAFSGCASGPANVAPLSLTCETVPIKQLTPTVSVQLIPLSVASPERERVRGEMIALVRTGRLKSALALGETQLASKQVEPDAEGNDAVELAGLITEVAELHQALRNMRSAEAGYLRAIEIYARRQYQHPEMLRPTVALATLYRSQGKPARALPLQLAAYPKLLTWLGHEHPDVIESESELAQLHLNLRQYDEAEVLSQARLDRARLAGDKAAMSYNLKALAKIRQARRLKRAR